VSSDTDLRRAARLKVAVAREVFVSHRIQDAFDFIAAEDVLPKILTGYGMVPGVASTANVSGSVGSPRHPPDRSYGGRQHRERGRNALRSAFLLRLSGEHPTFALEYLMTEASGQFRFETADGGTRVKWTYTFYAKDRLTRLPLALFVKSQWTGYMDVCLAHVIEHSAASPATGAA
jgi:hypothetical protein